MGISEDNFKSTNSYLKHRQCGVCFLILIRSYGIGLEEIKILLKKSEIFNFFGVSRRGLFEELKMSRSFLFNNNSIKISLDTI